MTPRQHAPRAAAEAAPNGHAVDAEAPATNAAGGERTAGGGATDRILEALLRFAELAWQQSALAFAEQARLVHELLRVAGGRSELAPASGDARFRHSAWNDHPLYKGWLQSYLAWRDGVNAWVDGAGLETVDTARARYLASLVTEAMAPTNFLLGNPAALEKAFATGGASLLRGAQNLLRDLATNGGMPSQVDRSAFAVGRNLALSPGAVVFRNEVCEVIQYTPASERVYARPLLIVPPQINKYYVLDLAPGRSLIEYAVGAGVQTFVVSWRNPTREQRDWGLDTYLRALLAAIQALRRITGSRDLNVMGVCAGAITLLPLLAHLAARRPGGHSPVHSITLLVALLDTGAESPLRMLASEPALELARQASQLQGVLRGDQMARLFTWLRPNDLVWSYWVNNYLLGNDPPAFDLLYWNNDTTRLPARLHHEFLDMFVANPFTRPGTLRALGTPVDLAQVTCDAYVVAGASDHITPWRGCYTTTRLLGGSCELVLNGSGHVQTVVNPPGNAKAKFHAGSPASDDPDAWLAAATPHAGSWWEHWRAWITARAGELRPAPAALGGGHHRPLAAAPGTYVHEA